MCKLRIIRNRLGSVASDIVQETKALGKVSSNNMPYFLTISDNGNIREYSFSFLGDKDRETIELLPSTNAHSEGRKIRLSYGIVTGRLYSIILPFGEKKLDSKDWSQLKNELSKINFAKDNAVNDFYVFISIVRDYELSNSDIKIDIPKEQTISKLKSDCEASLDTKALDVDDKSDIPQIKTP